MPDRRECILNKNLGDDFIATTPDIDIISFKDAMDEYFTERAFGLLEYMAKNEYKCYWMEDDNGEPYYFFSRGSGHQNLTKEQLFENFL